MSRKPAKTQHRKPTRPKRSNAAMAARPASSTLGDLQEQVSALTRELAETRKQLVDALEQQTATSEVLRVISSSPGELEPVFNAMLANAVRICEAKFGNLLLYDGQEFWMAARISGAPSDWVEAQRNPVIRLGPSAPIHRLVATKQTLHIPDAR